MNEPMSLRDLQVDIRYDLSHLPWTGIVGFGSYVDFEQRILRLSNEKANPTVGDLREAITESLRDLTDSQRALVYSYLLKIEEALTGSMENLPLLINDEDSLLRIIAKKRLAEGR